MKMESRTPEKTPPPISKFEAATQQDPVSPLSPLPPLRNDERPFSFEASNRPEPQAKSKTRALDTAAPMVSPLLAPVLPAQPAYPTRITSLDRPSSRRSTPPAPDPVSPLLSTTPAPPFTPLTHAPIPLPQRLIPEITSTHLNCYANHRMTIWSNNMFQPMGCMVCHSNETDRKWACTWCQLRICRGCSEALCMVPGRDLWVLMERRLKEGGGE
jgi:hypothetical protein